MLCLIAVVVRAQNLTPGDNVGSDHAAYEFGPYAWTVPLLNPAVPYGNHVCSGSNSGQQYFCIISEEDAAPNPRPTVCTLTNFVKQVNDTAYGGLIGTLLIVTHGDSEGLVIESYAKTAQGLAIRDSAFNAYTSQHYVPGFEIIPDQDASSYFIAITDEFIRKYAHLHRALVYIVSCYGGTLTDDFVAAGARVALGPPDCVSKERAYADAVTFFERMDGKQGQGNRPVAAAMAGLDLVSSGETNTTLAPSVLSLTAPCPIKSGDKVIYKLDTTCDPATIPDISGNGATIANERWLDAVTIEGTCTAPGPPGSYNYTLTLKWDTVKSSQNIARLDGNENPHFLTTNAEGPSNDDYFQVDNCNSGPALSGRAVIVLALLLYGTAQWTLVRRRSSSPPSESDSGSA